MFALVSLVEYSHKPPSLSWTEEPIVSLALGCFPRSAGRRAGSFMRCQGDRSTWPRLCCVRVSPRPPVLSADGSGDLLESRPRWTAVSSAARLCCSRFDVRQDVQGLASPRGRGRGRGRGRRRSQGVVRRQEHESDTAHDPSVYTLCTTA